MSPTDLRPAPAPESSDPAGVARFACVAVTALGAVGVGQAATRARLGRWQRLAAGAVGAAAVTAGIAGARRPERAAAAFFEHPRTMLALGVTPMAIAPLIGGRRTPLELLAVVGVGVGGATLGSRGPALGRAAAAYWIAQTLAINGWDEPATEDRTIFTYVVIPLAIESAVALAPRVLDAAREFRDLDRQLDEAQRDLDGLRDYQDDLRGALDQLGAALDDAGPSVESIADVDAHRVARDLLVRSRGRFQERVGALDAARGGVREAVGELLAARVAGMRSAAPPDSDVEVRDPVIESGVEVLGSQRLAVLAVAVTGLLSNALRHARGASRVDVTLSESDADGGRWLVLEVADDGMSTGNPRYPGRGLTELRQRASTLGGSLEAEPGDGRGWVSRLRLPAGDLARSEHQLASERVLEVVDEALAYSVRACALMVLGIAFRSNQVAGRHPWLVRAANTAVVAAYEHGERKGLWRVETRRSGGTQAASRRLLAVAAAVAALSPHRENALLSGWANAALARHGALAPPGEVAALTAAHAAAILVSYRGGWRKGVSMAIDQVGTCVFGPLGVGFAVSRARAALEARETALTSALVALEQTHDLAESFNRAHPCTDSVESLAMLLDDLPDVAGRLQLALDRIGTAGDSLPAPPTGRAWAEQFADSVRARIWPTPVRLVSDGASLLDLDESAISQATFRRRSLAIADSLGDALRQNAPPDWLGRPTLVSVTLYVSAEPRTTMVRCDVIPERRGRPARESTDRLATSLAHLGGSLTGGHDDGRISFDLYPTRFAAPTRGLAGRPGREVASDE